MKPSLKRIGSAVLAAVTSPEAIKAERSVAVLVAVRIALAFGASAEIANLLLKLR